MVAVDTVKRGELIETVVATGNAETPYRVTIGSQITGTVEDVNVAEGQRVTTGQKLVSLESGELQAAVGQALGAVAQAAAHMRQLAELTLPSASQSLKEAQATLLNAEKTFGRASVLYQSAINLTLGGYPKLRRSDSLPFIDDSGDGGGNGDCAHGHAYGA